MLRKIFLLEPVFEEMILQTKKFPPKNVDRKFLFQTYFRGDDFATTKLIDQNFLLKIFENFWFKPISEEKILQPQEFPTKKF